MGESKYVELGLEYTQEQTRPTEDADVAYAWQIFLDHGVRSELNPAYTY